MRTSIAFASAAVLVGIFARGAIAYPWDAQCWNPDEILISRPLDNWSALCVDTKGTQDTSDNEISLYKYRVPDAPYVSFSLVRLRNGHGRIAIFELEMNDANPLQSKYRHLSVFFNEQGEETRASGDEALAAEYKDDISEFLDIVMNNAGAIAQ